MDHTHYLMLDDGGVHNYDIKDYRTRLCLQLSKHHETDFLPSKWPKWSRSEVDEVSVYLFSAPIVTIVVEGGKDALKNMYNDLREDIPVVIIEVSQRYSNSYA